MLFRPPVISHIDDVLPWIKDKPEITHRIKEDYQVLDYVYVTKDTFDNPYARECRGIKFDIEGNIIARPYHKFHNLNENEEYLSVNVDLSQPHHILEKLDGSCVHLTRLGGSLRAFTRAGESEVAEKALKWLESDPRRFERYSKYTDTFKGCTLIFEYVAPHNRIVVPYAEENLILTAIRNNETGEYFSYNLMRPSATLRGFPCVQVSTHKDFESVTKDEKDEGVVVRFETGAMVKIKADAYVRKHRSKELVNSFKDLVKLIINNDLDDVLPQLDEDTKKKIVEYRDTLLDKLIHYGVFLNQEIIKYIGWDQKAFALHIQSKYSKLNQQLLFSTRKSRNAALELSNCIGRAYSDTQRLTKLFEELEFPIWEGSFFSD